MRLPICSPLRSNVRRVAAASLVALTLAACTGEDEPDPSGPPRTSPPPITSADSYVYTDAAGIEARVTIEGDGAVLTFTNDTGAELSEPSLLVLDARDGTHTDWGVVDAASVPEGESEWQVQRGPVPDPKHIGLVVLLLGGEDYGAFVPPQPEDGA